MWTFGQNNHGQIGDGLTTTPRKTPYQVAGLSDIVAVAAGGHHVLALRDDGTLYAWGHNQYGQLGIRTTVTPQRTPVMVLITDVVAIAAGQYHSVALKSNGDIYTWGRNDLGQLADGNHGASLISSTPLYIMTGGAAVGAGLSHTLIVKTDGTVWGAGENGDGQLGNASTIDSDEPVPMTGISTAVAAAAGMRHSVVLLSDGTVRAAGYDGQGQLGNGLPAQAQSTPGHSVRPGERHRSGRRPQSQPGPHVERRAVHLGRQPDLGHAGRCDHHDTVRAGRDHRRVVDRRRRRRPPAQPGR